MNEKGIVLLIPLLAVALATWTAGWIYGQKRICGQAGTCSWKTGTASLK